MEMEVLKPQKMTTKKVVSLVFNNPNLIKKAILCLYARQTENERKSDCTIYLNNRGFSATDAHVGGFLARYIMQGNTLEGVFLEKSKSLVYKYRKQLTSIANNF